MDISEQGIEFITEWEGLSLKPYKDAAGFWTIGYGHLIGKDLGPWKEITKETAIKLLRADLFVAEGGVNSLVKQPLTQEEYDALVSFVYNIGVRAFSKSTLLRKLNEGDKHAAAREFVRWNVAGGRVVRGLTRRRNRETLLFSAGAYTTSELISRRPKKLGVHT